MANGIRTGDPRGFNKGCSSKFLEGSRVRQTPEEGRRTYRPKRCGNNNKDEDNSPKSLNDKNQQASSQKFKQLIIIIMIINPESVLENEMHKLHYDFVIQTDHLILVRQPDLGIVNNKKKGEPVK